MNVRIASTLCIVGTLAILAMGLWFMAGSELPPVSAGQAMQATCGQMTELDAYDTIATAKRTLNGVAENWTVTVKGSVSGKDFRVSITSDDSAMLDELIQVDGVGYFKSSTGSNTWEETKTPYRDFNSALSALGATPICPDFTGVLRKGEEELDGVKVTVYVSGDEITALDKLDDDFRGVKQANRHEYWVDQTGLLVLHKWDHLQVGHYDDGYRREVSHDVMTTRFMGVGEVNTITAPVLGE